MFSNYDSVLFLLVAILASSSFVSMALFSKPATALFVPDLSGTENKNSYDLIYNVNNMKIRKGNLRLLNCPLNASVPFCVIQNDMQ